MNNLRSNKIKKNRPQNNLFVCFRSFHHHIVCTFGKEVNGSGRIFAKRTTFHFPHRVHSFDKNNNNLPEKKYTEIK